MSDTYAMTTLNWGRESQSCCSKAIASLQPAVITLLRYSGFRQATGAALPWDINPSIWRSSTTIRFASNLFFGQTQAPFQAQFLTMLGPKETTPGHLRAAVTPTSRASRSIVGQLVSRARRKSA
jgi:hypothetical protein